MSCNKKVWGLVLAYLLWAVAASASYTSAQLVAGPEVAGDGSVHYLAVFSGAGEQTVKQDVLLPATGNVQDALRVIADKLNHTKSKDNTLPAIGVTFDVTPSGTVGPTPEDLAYTAFQALVVTWRSAQIKLPIGGAVDKDVSDAAAAMLAAYGSVSPTQRNRYDQLLVIYGKGI